MRGIIFRTFLTVCFLTVSVLSAACGGDDEPATPGDDAGGTTDSGGTADGGGGMDSSTPPTDGSTPGDDGSTPGDDADLPFDAGPTPDGSLPACRRNNNCAATEYCNGAGCRTTGVCEARPTVCTDDLMPVCGCDGTTYSNPCEAAAAGVRVESDGMCGMGTTCTANDDCRMREYCAGRDCAGDGICAPQPTDCPAVFEPVCGCDGNTYGNACGAASAGVRVRADGACPDSA